MKKHLVPLLIPALFLTACGHFGEERNVEFVSYHKHHMFDGGNDGWVPGDSVREDGTSTLFGGKLHLEANRFSADFSPPLGQTDTVIDAYDAVRREDGTYDIYCHEADGPVAGKITSIPFAISDSIVFKQVQDKDWIKSRQAWHYELSCRGHLETGEIHLLSLVWWSSDPIGN